MSKMNSLLTQRLKVATEKISKMTNLAELSTGGNLSSFSGVFRIVPLGAQEEATLEELLTTFAEENQPLEADLKALSTLTSEVKAINNQAAILHGERIKKAGEILKKYRDGAFTAWMVATYGNRQTPYNFLQYYELHSLLSPELHEKFETAPKQVAYTLASRNGPLEKKEQILRSFSGQSKQELLSLIRLSLPLAQDDKRAQDLADYAVRTLTRLHQLINHPTFRPTEKQKSLLKELLQSIKTLTI